MPFQWAPSGHEEMTMSETKVFAMTYSAGGRFMVPLQPLLAALVAGAVVYLPSQALTFVRGSSVAMPRASA